MTESTCTQCGAAINYTLELDQAKVEIERLREALKDICVKYYEWYNYGKWYTSDNDAAYGLYMLAALSCERRSDAMWL